jgi:adenylosuccinate synthase
MVNYSTHSYAILDGQFGSTGKGLIAGYMAESRRPTLVMSNWAPNAGHTYITSDGKKITHTQLPIGIVSPRIRAIMIGPGSIFDQDAFEAEVRECIKLGINTFAGVDVLIHENAAIVTQEDRDTEKALGLSNIGSTLKGTMAAQVRKLQRGQAANVAKQIAGFRFRDNIVKATQWDGLINKYSYITQIEGAQGFSLSLNHGFYPYVTSRDVTPMQLFADVGLNFDRAKQVQVIQSLRTFPIRVNNRTGSSGPGYPDQKELNWAELGMEAELTTVTKLPRRIFTWSRQQLEHMTSICGVPGLIFLNFVNYARSGEELARIVADITEVCGKRSLRFLGLGPEQKDVYDLWDHGDREELSKRCPVTAEMLNTSTGRELLANTTTY